MSTTEALEPQVVPPIGDDNPFYEVVGELRVELPPNMVNGIVLGNRIGMAMGEFAESQGVGRATLFTLFRLRSNPDLQRRPDAVYISFDRWAKGRRIPRLDHWDVIPDIAVEVVSPGTLIEQLITKVREYFEAGVRRVWIIYTHESLVYEYDSPRSIRVFMRENVLEGGEILSGFRLPLAELLEGPEDAASA